MEAIRCTSHFLIVEKHSGPAVQMKRSWQLAKGEVSPTSRAIAILHQHVTQQDFSTLK